MARAHKQQVVESDVVIVGAGIIGLLTASQLLQQGMSVALVERKQLCAGATGAGQGYLWVAHRSPDTVGWQLATTSMAMWRDMLQQDPSLSSAIEYQAAGSLLLASTAAEAEDLSSRHHSLSKHGVQTKFLDAAAVRAMEPALSLPGEGAGLLAPADAQINGRKTAAYLLERCKRHKGFQLFFDKPISGLSPAPGSGHGVSVDTATRTLRGRRATVVTAGAWSGPLLSALTGAPYDRLLAPRRGHLLEVARPQGMPALKTGMMEMSYAKHYTLGNHGGSSTSSSSSGSASGPGSTEVDITFTATQSAAGTLLLGSSREFSGWDNDGSQPIIDTIMQRAAQFLPALAGVNVAQSDTDAVRVGLRPFAHGGLPMVGPVPDVPGLYVAAGHEGSGLCLGPATAHMLCGYVGGGAPDRAHAHVYEELLPATRLLLAEL